MQQKLIFPPELFSTRKLNLGGVYFSMGYLQTFLTENRPALKFVFWMIIIVYNYLID